VAKGKKPHARRGDAESTGQNPLRHPKKGSSQGVLTLINPPKKREGEKRGGGGYIKDSFRKKGGERKGRGVRGQQGCRSDQNKKKRKRAETREKPNERTNSNLVRNERGRETST